MIRRNKFGLIFAFIFLLPFVYYAYLVYYVSTELPSQSAVGTAFAGTGSPPVPKSPVQDEVKQNPIGTPGLFAVPGSEPSHVTGKPSAVVSPSKPPPKHYIAEPQNEITFWTTNEDRQFMAQLYPKLGQFSTILDVGARGYTARCKDMIASETTKYYQLEPYPPNSGLNNDGLLETTMQGSLAKYPEYRQSFDAVVDYGVLGWGAIEFSKQDIKDYIHNVRGLLKNGGLWALKIDQDAHKRMDYMLPALIEPYFESSDFAGFKNGMAIGTKGKTAYFFYKMETRRPGNNATTEAFVASLYSSKMDPDADAECNVVVSTMNNVALYDKIGPTLTPIDTKQQTCPASKATYTNGVLRFRGNVDGVTVSTVAFDRCMKQLDGSGLDKGGYSDPQWRPVTEKETSLESEFVRVRYPGGDEERFVQAQPKKQVGERQTNSENPNVLLLVIDNLSRQAATWTLPKTMAFLRKRSKNTFVFNRMGSTGHSTAPSMTPILTGKPYDMDALDRDRIRTRRYTPSDIVEADIITTVARANGYVTTYATNEADSMFLGCYWWDRSWFDHVGPPPGKEGESNSKCFGQFTNHQHGFSYIRSLWDTYEPLEHPVFTYYHAFHGHATPAHANVLDVDIMLLVKEALSRNTVVFLIGDHGQYAQFQSKLPLATISVPDTLATTLGIGDAAAMNQRRLVSQYDLYQTLRFLVSPHANAATTKGLGINLAMDSVSRTRSCADAGIPDFRCFCSIFTPVAELPSEWKDAAEASINKEGHTVAPQDCARARVTAVRRVRRMVTCIGQSRFHFDRGCDYDHAPHQEVQWVADVETSLRQNFTVRLSLSRTGLSPEGKPLPFENIETDAQRDTYAVASAKARQKVTRFSTELKSIDVKQLTRYKRYEGCTPANASAQFCVCDHTSIQSTQKTQKTLLVVAHPDDEVVFYGNDLVESTYVVVVTNANSHATGAHRQQAFKKVMAAAGVTEYELWDFPESPNWRISVKQFWSEDIRNAVRDKVVELIRTVKPTQIYTHGKVGEYGHINHREIHAAVHAAFRQEFSCDLALAACGRADAPLLFTFNPDLDYSNPEDRLTNLPSTCAESLQKKKLLDLYVNQKALTVHNFHELCLRYENMYPTLAADHNAKAAPQTTPTDLVPPVDVVIPWSGIKAGDMTGVNRDDGIVRYTIRSIRKHMSWVRTIYLFADPMPNPPKWMSTEFGDQVQLVDRCAHFIGGSTNCPTQNTFAIYANFHTIPGLAEHFIACDDDVLITSPLTREHFFIDGKAAASVSGVTDIYSGITIEDGVSYVTELATPYNDGGKRALPTKLPKQIRGVMHTAYPLLRSAIEEMQTEFADWFGFVSSHRVRFCFHKDDKHQQHEPNNVNGACWHENTKYAFVWYMHSQGLVTPPKRKVPEFAATYADVTERRLGKLFEPGKHATVNINDSVMWRSKDLVALSKEPTAQAEYGARREYLQSALNVAFPLAK